MIKDVIWDGSEESKKEITDLFLQAGYDITFFAGGFSYTPVPPPPGDPMAPKPKRTAALMGIRRMEGETTEFKFAIPRKPEAPPSASPPAPAAA